MHSYIANASTVYSPAPHKYMIYNQLCQDIELNCIEEIISRLELSKCKISPYLLPNSYLIVIQNMHFNIALFKGVYPQSEESLGIVNINASKGFVDLWVH